ncbi:hypothetical protein HBI56_112170 [Parastagonospora nodorum]|nr:hypothetical protein HBH51_050530 [Parastagonospora nodorum]KAH4130412.1 hypothetical protein HBH47_024940 [Parastagonospora nodorum]KAH4302624.1 hypothetical protein HBI01_092050 [Parastagonospora nodorum]KAH4371752.1 hypothetical protein HBH94_117820 [Parastagonospora nodorum]KAH4418509.1 hypothetical protein HBH99_060380 [Parastagonospora nodorum]
MVSRRAVPTGMRPRQLKVRLSKLNYSATNPNMYLATLLALAYTLFSVAIAKIPPPDCSNCPDIGAKRCHYANFKRQVQECKYDTKVAHGCWKTFQSCGLHTCTEDGGAHCWEN